ncbi:MAG TPA: cysteine methyltransferase [Planctomycetaceae bacterium]|nr:cysteine methyltransferase [Planctomycetaceae bacterium]
MTAVYHTEIESPLGPLLMTMDRGQLTNVCMFQQKRIASIPPESISDHGPFDRVIKQLDEYFSGGRREFDIPLRLDGTPFQVSVWNELRKIPFGTTTTYGEIARRIGNPKAVRAVGLANGRNPIPIIVPCHRVIGSNGTLAGFGGGLENKSRLLDLEKRQNRTGE